MSDTRLHLGRTRLANGMLVLLPLVIGAVGFWVPLLPARPATTGPASTGTSSGTA